MLAKLAAFAKAIAALFGFAEKVTAEVHDANQRQAGVDAAEKKGLQDVVDGAQTAKRAEVAMDSTAANPDDRAWADRVHQRFRRPD